MLSKGATIKEKTIQAFPSVTQIKLKRVGDGAQKSLILPYDQGLEMLLFTKQLPEFLHTGRDDLCVVVKRVSSYAVPMPPKKAIRETSP